MGFPSWTKLSAAVWPNASAIAKSDVRQWGLEAEAAINAAVSHTALINGYIVWSVAANVLTLAVKTNAGADPTVADPVYADFRSATQTSGAPSIVAITAALSLTVSAGSKLGFADTINGRVWATLFNNAGTAALGVFNAYGGNAGTPPASAGTIHPLYPSLVATTTAEGGAGAADSAGVHYTTAALTSKAFIVLGHATWETALATAGNWSAAPDVVHQQRLGDKLPGDLVQRQASFDGAVASGTTTTPLDDTIPQSTEGNQFMTLAVTPMSKANLLEIEHEANYAISAAVQAIGALFQDSGVNALVAKAIKITASGDDCIMRLVHRMLAATVTSTTMKVRVGPSGAGTITFNGSGGTRLFAGVNYGRLEIVERMA